MLRSIVPFWILIAIMTALLLYASYLALDGPLAARAELRPHPVIEVPQVGFLVVVERPLVEASLTLPEPAFEPVRTPTKNTLDRVTRVAIGTLTHADILDDLNIIGLCESGGDYTLNTGNGFYGKYQFSLETWQAVGGEGYPHLASPQEQDARAGYLLTHYGAGHWPFCGRLIVELQGLVPGEVFPAGRLSYVDFPAFAFASTGWHSDCLTRPLGYEPSALLPVRRF